MMQNVEQETSTKTPEETEDDPNSNSRRVGNRKLNAARQTGNTQLIQQDHGRCGTGHRNM